MSSTRHLGMQRSGALRWACAHWLGMMVWLLGPSWAHAAGEVITIKSNGPTSSKINLVLLAEGYQSGERAKFINDSQKISGGLLGNAPVSAYKSFFNVFGIFVASVDSGSDKPTSGIARNTYFNSTFNSYGIQRLITIPPNDRNRSSADGEGKVRDLLRDLAPDYDLAAVVVNDSEYGGSGGPVLVVSTHSSSAEIATHEMGHTFAKLGDEYGDAYPGYPDSEEPNTTREARREFLKWHSWVLTNTPLPTPPESRFQSLVGLFAGAHYHETGWYRPKLNCKMRSLGTPFCEVCSEAFVLSIYDRIGTVDSVVPSNDRPVAVSVLGSQRFRISPVAAVDDSIVTEWTLNGTPLVPLNPAELELAGTALNGNSNELTVVVGTQSPRVRSDPTLRARETVTWSVLRDLSMLPSLAIRLRSGAVEISWDVSAGSFALESAINLRSLNWVVVAAKPTAVGGHLMLTIPTSPGRTYFRLRRP